MDRALASDSGAVTSTPSLPPSWAAKISSSDRLTAGSFTVVTTCSLSGLRSARLGWSLLEVSTARGDTRRGTRSGGNRAGSRRQRRRFAVTHAMGSGGVRGACQRCGLVSLPVTDNIVCGGGHSPPSILWVGWSQSTTTFSPSRADTLSVMEARELSIPGAFEFNPRTFPDGRGVFVAPFQESAFLATVGYPLRVAQTNHSVSRRGALRGVHFADVPPGQAKYVYCPSGALLDVVIDIRVGSPTFGKSDAVILDSTEFKALYVSEGLGHAFIALKDDTIISYLCTTGYNPQAEHGIHPLDPALALPWPGDIEPLLSEKDLAAPTLAEAERGGLLPTYEDCRAHYEELRMAALT